MGNSCITLKRKSFSFNKNKNIKRENSNEKNNQTPNSRDNLIIEMESEKFDLNIEKIYEDNKFKKITPIFTILNSEDDEEFGLNSDSSESIVFFEYPSSDISPNNKFPIGIRIKNVNELIDSDSE